MKIQKKYLPDEAAMENLGSQLAQATRSQNQCLIYLQGELGAGKTTLVRAYLRALGYRERVKSPTYTLVECYQLPEQEVYHFDLYRMDNARALYEIGIEDYLNHPAICLVEWPERGQGVLPQADLLIGMRVLPIGREIEIQAAGVVGEKIMERLAHAMETP